MYIIDETYFVRDLNVPNKGVSLDVPDNELSLDWYIDKYARQLLQNALGNVLFDDFNGNVTNGAYVPGVTKWDNLVNGVTYTYQDKTYKWKGLKFTEGAFKGSVLAHYTYYHWLNDQLSKTSGFGEVKGKAVNSESINSTSKIVKIWNDFITMYQGYTSLDAGYNFSYINDIPFYDYLSQNDSDYVNLLDFLKHNETDYPDALLLVEREGYENSMGL